MQEKVINFFTDYGFKRLFGAEPSKICLIDFLNGILDGCEKPIVDLQYHNPMKLGACKVDRKAVFD